MIDFAQKFIQVESNIVYSGNENILLSRITAVVLIIKNYLEINYIEDL